jgi:hypothetical protein
MNIIDDAYRSFCTERFPLPGEAKLAELEERIRVSIPDDYRNFILQFNGGYFTEPEIEPVSEGCPLDGLRSVFGIGAPDGLTELGNPADLALFDDNDPPEFIPIGSTAMGGLIILIVTGEESGCILLKQAFGDFSFLADGIEEFFSLLRDHVTQIELRDPHNT